MTLFLNVLVFVAAVLFVTVAHDRSGHCATRSTDAVPNLACVLAQSLRGAGWTVEPATTAAMRPTVASVPREMGKPARPATSVALSPTPGAPDASQAPRPTGPDGHAGTAASPTAVESIAVTRDEQRRAFRSAEGLAEAAALADTLAARLAEERREVARARAAVAKVRAEAEASDNVALAARAAARRSAARAEKAREEARAAESELREAQQRSTRLKQEIAEAAAQAAAQEASLRALERRADQSVNSAAAATEAGRSSAMELEQVRQRTARLEREIADAVSLASAHEEALRALERQVNDRATAVAEATRAEEARLAQAEERSAQLRQKIADASARAAVQEEALRALERDADRRTAAAAAEADRAGKARLAHAQQLDAELRQEIEDAVARVSAHEEALRALERQISQREEATSEAERRNAESIASLVAAERSAEEDRTRLEAAQSRAAELRRAATAAEMGEVDRRAELDAAQRAAIATERAISAVEERIVRLRELSAAAGESLARETAHLSAVRAASEALAAADGGPGLAGAPASLLAYAQTVSPQLPPEEAPIDGAADGNADQAPIAVRPRADEGPAADDHAETGAIEVAAGEVAVDADGAAVPTPLSAEQEARTGGPSGEPAAIISNELAGDVASGMRLDRRPSAVPHEADAPAALPPLNPARKEPVALASYTRLDSKPSVSTAPVFSARGIGTVSLSAPDASLRVVLEEDVEAELAFGGSDALDRVAAAIGDDDVVHYSRVFDDAVVISGVDNDPDHPGYYTLVLQSADRTAILQLRFAATPALGARQAVRDVVNGVACSALFGSTSLPCRQQLGANGAER